MKLSKTELNDVDKIMNIINDAQISLANYHIDQWQDGYPNKETIINDIKLNQSYKVTKGNEIIAYMMISFNGELDYNQIYEGKWHKASNYAVIHRLCLNKDYKGQALSYKVLNLAFAYIKSKGCDYVRIDTHPDNFIMRKLLKNLHFNECGKIYLSRGKALRIGYDIIIM